METVHFVHDNHEAKSETESLDHLGELLLYHEFSDHSCWRVAPNVHITFAADSHREVRGAYFTDLVVHINSSRDKDLILLVMDSQASIAVISTSVELPLSCQKETMRKAARSLCHLGNGLNLLWLGFDLSLALVA